MTSEKPPAVIIDLLSMTIEAAQAELDELEKHEGVMHPDKFVFMYPNGRFVVSLNSPKTRMGLSAARVFTAEDLKTPPDLSEHVDMDGNSPHLIDYDMALRIAIQQLKHALALYRDLERQRLYPWSGKS